MALLKTAVRLATASATVVALGATQAAAQCYFFGLICIGGGGSGGGGQPASVPEIDATQGLAAMAIAITAGLVIRERFLRARK